MNYYVVNYLLESIQMIHLQFMNKLSIQVLNIQEIVKKIVKFLLKNY